MDELYFSDLETLGVSSKLELLQNKDYTHYIAQHDPSRFDWNIATSLDDLIFSTVELYNLSEKTKKIITEEKIKATNLASGSFGKVWYAGQIYLLMFYSPQVRAIS